MLPRVRRSALKNMDYTDRELLRLQIAEMCRIRGTASNDARRSLGEIRRRPPLPLALQFLGREPFLQDTGHLFGLKP
jgi:hypothetical protein